jgi:hypothetical protein
MGFFSKHILECIDGSCVLGSRDVVALLQVNKALNRMTTSFIEDIIPSKRWVLDLANVAAIAWIKNVVGKIRKVKLLIHWTHELDASAWDKVIDVFTEMVSLKDIIVHDGGNNIAYSNLLDEGFLELVLPDECTLEALDIRFECGAFLPEEIIPERICGSLTSLRWSTYDNNEGEPLPLTFPELPRLSSLHIEGPYRESIRIDKCPLITSFSLILSPAAHVYDSSPTVTFSDPLPPLMYLKVGTDNDVQVITRILELPFERIASVSIACHSFAHMQVPILRRLRALKSLTLSNLKLDMADIPANVCHLNLLACELFNPEGVSWEGFELLNVYMDEETSAYAKAIHFLNSHRVRATSSIPTEFAPLLLFFGYIRNTLLSISY